MRKNSKESKDAEERKDKVLVEIFEALASVPIAGHPDGMGSKGLLFGEIYYICGRCVYKGVPTRTEQRQTPGKPYKYKHLDLYQLPDMDMVRPEILLDTHYLPLDSAMCDDLGADAYMIPLDKAPDTREPELWIVRQLEPGVFDTVLSIPRELACMKGMSPMPVYVPPEVYTVLTRHELSLSDFNISVTKDKKTSVIVMTMIGHTGMINIPLNRIRSKEAFKAVYRDNVEYTGDGWNDDRHAYGKLKQTRRTKNMKGLGNPLSRVKVAQPEIAAAQPQPQSQPQPQAPAQDPAPAAVQEPVQAQKTEKVQEAVKAPEPVQTQEAVKEQEPEKASVGFMEPMRPRVETDVTHISDPCPEGQTEAPAEPSPAESHKAALAQESGQREADKPRRTRARRTSSAKVDLAAVLDYMTSPVQDAAPERFDDMQSEIRALRDLQIAVARRMTNITAEIVKISKESIVKWEAVQEVMKK